jgi:pimeloyl-ACP methyl ester carboxylesterase
VRWGDHDAPVAVVLEHGYALDHRSWRAIAALLPQAVEGLVGVLAYDHRGHGESGRASPAAATMTQLGHVMGGLAAMGFTQRHRALFADRVEGLVLLPTSAVGLTTEASAAWPNALGKLTRDLESVLGSKVVGLVRERTSEAVSAGLRWWLFGENAEPV